MKKYTSIFLFMLTGFISNAQIQRTVKQKNDSSTVEPVDKNNKDSRREMLKELNLTKEQRGKMKELNQSMKASKASIEADTTLSETARREKLKTLRKEQAVKIQAILTEEQKIKFRQLKAKKDEER